MENIPNNGFGHITFKRLHRDSYARVVTIFIAVVLLSIQGIYLKEKDWYDVILEDIGPICAILSAILTGEIFHRILLCTEEFFHIKERYEGSYLKAIWSCISFNESNNMVLSFWFISFFATTLYWQKNLQATITPLYFVLFALINSVGMKLIGAKELASAELSQISESRNKDIAAGLAWSYYFGYLKLILPGLHGMIDEATLPSYGVGEVDLRNLIKSKKVHIVMPRSCYCYKKLSEVDPRINEKNISLPPQRITRGGVQERVYKNTLYQIDMPGEETRYVMMEYATPLLAMYDMSKESLAGFSNKDLEIQVIEFYKTLKMILEQDQECNDKSELVLISEDQSNLASIISKLVDKDVN